MKLQQCLARPQEFLTSELLMSWILAGRRLHFYPAKFVIISVTLVLEVPAVLELSGRKGLCNNYLEGGGGGGGG